MPNDVVDVSLTSREGTDSSLDVNLTSPKRKKLTIQCKEEVYRVITSFAKKHDKTLGDVLEDLMRDYIKHNTRYKTVVDERGVILSSTDPLMGLGGEFKKIVDAMPKLYRDEDVIHWDQAKQDGELDVSGSAPETEKAIAEFERKYGIKVQ